jgi:transketolase
MPTSQLQTIAKALRHHIIKMTTEAGSGHLTSSLSSVELMTYLYFGKVLKFDLNDPLFPNNDRVIFSKGHASPLFYALYKIAGKLTSEELLSLRKFGSPLEGHPTKNFPYTEVATGSLGQGLSVGVGMAINAKYLDKLPYKTYVLLGDSEMAEGSNWEAIQLASHYKLDNLVGIIDANRLGQRGETLAGHDLDDYAQKMEAFGWQVIIVKNGHNFKQIEAAFSQIDSAPHKPKMIIAKTTKGKGVSFIEDRDGWHGKALDEKQAEKALAELGVVKTEITASPLTPLRILPTEKKPTSALEIDVVNDDGDNKKPLATRKAYGEALVELAPKYPNLVVLDAEVSNSTYAQTFAQKYPKRFFEMFIAEQNMVGTAVGLATRNKIPFVSTFAAFLTRALDQIRVSQYSKSNLNFVGSHAGVSIGEDGPTQMGLEDIAMFRSILGSAILYPADQISTKKLVEAMINHPGICYMRTTRADTKPLYGKNEKFEIGGSKTLKESKKDSLTIVAAGITLYEALEAYRELMGDGITVRIIDLYSIKPLDYLTLKKAANETRQILVVEDHFSWGGMADAVREALSTKPVPIYSLAVNKMPRSGTMSELLSYHKIDAEAIIAKTKQIVSKKPTS